MLPIYLSVLEMSNLTLAVLIVGVILTFKYGRLFVSKEIPAASKRIAAVLYGVCLFGLSGIVLVFS
ncbi:hypothetical protein D3D03_05415 [Exiguobacterium sp. RIT452]|uniref:hypothetical protein n=1 Tax=Exiguobacterium TaxID=33986 RepID=UPI000E76498B|nr:MULTISPECIES: hypothetical protein [unclassified Exiguobacterium]RJP02783.1 hypothetical protein D3D03_05415 [Exiguobacterium sp. RIT452]